MKPVLLRLGLTIGSSRSQRCRNPSASGALGVDVAGSKKGASLFAAEGGCSAARAGTARHAANMGNIFKPVPSIPHPLRLLFLTLADGADATATINRPQRRAASLTFAKAISYWRSAYRGVRGFDSVTISALSNCSGRFGRFGHGPTAVLRSLALPIIP